MLFVVFSVPAADSLVFFLPSSLHPPTLYTIPYVFQHVSFPAHFFLHSPQPLFFIFIICLLSAVSTYSAPSKSEEEVSAKKEPQKISRSRIEKKTLLSHLSCFFFHCRKEGQAVIWGLTNWGDRKIKTTSGNKMCSHNIWLFSNGVSSVQSRGRKGGGGLDVCHVTHFSNCSSILAFRRQKLIHQLHLQKNTTVFATVRFNNHTHLETWVHKPV